MQLLTDNASFILLTTTQIQTLTKVKTDTVLNYEIVVFCRWLIYTTICEATCIFGVGTNIINVVCFIKQGFKDPVNVSFFGLALSDISCLLTMSNVNILLTPAVNAADLPFDATEMTYMVGGMPHTAFTRVTGCYTALITLERCLCITMPLKVKVIFTSKRMAIILVCIFVVLIASAAPVYAVNIFGMKFFPDRNKTILGIHYTDNREIVERFSFAINNILVPSVSFVIIITCTVILVAILRKKTEWRQKSASSTHGDSVSNRNRKVAKMVVMISTLFIACYIPIMFTFMGMCLEPEFSLYGKYENILFIVGGIGFVLESINSSVNIFIYYSMSSNYREILNELFGVKRNELKHER